MAQTADIGSKRIIGLDPTAWLQWVTQRPDVVAHGILATGEFQWISRETDALIRAYSPTEGEFLALNEIQFQPHIRVPVRVNAYSALAVEKYALPVYPVVINLLPPPGNRPIADRYEQTFMGLTARRDFRIINLWEVDVDIVFRRPIPSLLPFVPLLRGGSEEAMIRRAVRDLRHDERWQDLEPLLAFFASFVLESRVVQQIMRWDMVILEKSPWYRDILERGRLEGLEEGRLEGLEEGRLSGLEEGRLEGLEEGRLEGLEEGRLSGLEEGEHTSLHHTLERILRLRFGVQAHSLPARLQSLDTRSLEQLVDTAVQVSSAEEFLAQLPQENEGSGGEIGEHSPEGA
jgi:predicted transposase YdaD